MGAAGPRMTQEQRRRDYRGENVESSGGPHERRREASGRRGAGALARHPCGAGRRGRGARPPRHAGADRATAPRSATRTSTPGSTRSRSHSAGHIYSRNTNPTVRAFEDKVADPRGSRGGHQLLLRHGRGQQHALHAAAAGRSRRLGQGHLRRHQPAVHRLPAALGIDVELCDTDDYEQIEAAIAEGCRLLYLESPTNPTLKVMDIARLSAAAHEAGALVVADNTFATPINQNPLALGADLVLHSATKFLGGHADALGGVLCGRRRARRDGLPLPRDHRRRADPMAAYLLCAA